jgi:hypothetical protein
MLIMSEDESIQPDKEAGDCGIVGSEAQVALKTWLDEMGRRGVLDIGQRLESTSLATTVRVHQGETLVTDGPFGETKEHVAGIHMINCADLDEAIEIAAKHPCTLFGGVIEIRPVYVFDWD